MGLADPTELSRNKHLMCLEIEYHLGNIINLCQKYDIVNERTITATNSNCLLYYNIIALISYTIVFSCCAVELNSLHWHAENGIAMHKCECLCMFVITPRQIKPVLACH